MEQNSVADLQKSPLVSATAVWLVNSLIHCIFTQNFLCRTTFVSLHPNIWIRHCRLGKIYDRLSKVGDTLEYFATQEWKFTNYNVQNLWKEMTPEDQSIFFFDMEQMSWRYQTEALCLGLRVYMLKDDVDTLPKARKKWNRWVFHS